MSIRFRRFRSLKHFDEKGNTMTKQEILQWINDAVLVDWHDEIDNEGNTFQARIYEKDNQLFALHFCNDVVDSVFDPSKGFIRGTYEPALVTRETKEIKVKRTTYALCSNNSDLFYTDKEECENHS